MALVVRRRRRSLSGQKQESHESVDSYSPELSSRATGDSASTIVAEEKDKI